MMKHETGRSRWGIWAAGLMAMALSGCAVEEAELAGEEGAASEAEEARVSGPAFVYLRVRQDYRRCVSPLCGGVFVSRVNYRTMRCADGVYRGECYVGTVDATALSEEAQEWSRSSAAILRGRIEPFVTEGFGNLGRLVLTEAWRPGAPDRTSALTPELVRDNGRRCVRAPCFSLDAVRLNRGVNNPVSGLTLDGLGADRATLAQARADLARDASGVIVAGHRAPRGEAVTLVPEQFWVRVGEGVRDEQFCNSDDECTRTQYGTLVTRAADCACPSLCPVWALNVTAATENQRYFQRYCRNTLASCPVARCARPPEVACIRHACGTAPLDGASR